MVSYSHSYDCSLLCDGIGDVDTRKLPSIQLMMETQGKSSSDDMKVKF